MLTFIAVWMVIGLGQEIGHQMEDPNSNVVGIVGRTVAWPAATVEKRQEVVNRWENEGECAPTGDSQI